ncbi:hypothetical protein BU15DRAFT_77661 [Melanogaster broomeanus]|nr:hypothetical protein BU15DRAFT_77661 [Melanogaster broomeanus]
MNISYSEASPLISRKEEQKASREWLLPAMLAIFAILGSFLVFWITFPLTYCNDPLDPDVRDRIRNEWDYEWRQHEALAHIHRQQEERWKKDEIAHERLIREWAQERDAHDREIKEREAREEAERLRLNLVWVNEESHSCITYGTREYTARLANVPSGYKRGVEACKKTPLVIHDVSYLPHTCKDNGPGGIVGSWRVNQGQPDCTPFWGDYKDKGCTAVGSGKRRIEHHLVNLPTGGDWKEFAAATPVRFNGLQFSGAEEAFKSFWGGVYGLWEIDDHEC